MIKITVRPATKDRKEWYKYLDELKKETEACIVENQVP